MPIERKHRLPPAAYRGRKSVAITGCAEDRRVCISTEETVTAFVAQLKRLAAKHACAIPIYCFMPDHFHMIVQGLFDHRRPNLLADQFKHDTGVWFSLHRPDLDWQGSYYDHIIREEDDWRRQAFYVLNNPVRKRLIEDPFEYPYSGSIGYDLRLLFDGLY